MGPHEHLPLKPHRRSFITAVAGLPFLNEFALAQRSLAGFEPEGGVMINANEFPLGPCAEARATMREYLENGGRYFFGEAQRLAAAAAQSENVPPSHVMAFAGSSDPLYRTVTAFCGQGRAFVTGSPGYEAGENVASWLRVPVRPVPLRAPGLEHDVEAMLKAADAKPALFYVVNPNNPTGTVTPRAAMEALVNGMPQGSVLMVDEAYIHFAGIPSSIEFVLAGKDVVVLRTFSKIYGMAGLRAGLAFARPELLEKIRPHGVGYVPTTGMAGARVSLAVKGLVEDRRAYIAKTRQSVLAWLREKGFEVTPSVSNKFMVNTGRPGREVSAALAREGVFVGRPWPVWPNHVRVTIGTPAEMETFKKAFSTAMQL